MPFVHAGHPIERGRWADPRVAGNTGVTQGVRVRPILVDPCVQALRDAAAPSDPRVGPSATFDWLPGVHERQLQRLAQRSERDGTPG